MKNSLGFTVHQLAFIIDKRIDEVLQKRLQLGFSQAKILLGIKHANGVKQVDIATFLQQSEAGVSRQIKILQSKGLLKSVSDDSNKRNKVVILTDEGKRVSRQVTQLIEGVYDPLFGRLSYSEQQHLRQLIERLLLSV